MGNSETKLMQNSINGVFKLQGHNLRNGRSVIYFLQLILQNQYNYLEFHPDESGLCLITLRNNLKVLFYFYQVIPGNIDRSLEYQQIEKIVKTSLVDYCVIINQNIDSTEDNLTLNVVLKSTFSENEGTYIRPFTNRSFKITYKTNDLMKTIKINNQICLIPSDSIRYKIQSILLQAAECILTMYGNRLKETEYNDKLYNFLNQRFLQDTTSRLCIYKKLPLPLYIIDNSGKKFVLPTRVLEPDFVVCQFPLDEKINVQQYCNEFLEQNKMKYEQKNWVAITDSWKYNPFPCRPLYCTSVECKAGNYETNTGDNNKNPNLRTMRSVCVQNMGYITELENLINYTPHYKSHNPYIYTNDEYRVHGININYCGSIIQWQYIKPKDNFEFSTTKHFECTSLKDSFPVFYYGNIFKEDIGLTISSYMQSNKNREENMGELHKTSSEINKNIGANQILKNITTDYPENFFYHVNMQEIKNIDKGTINDAFKNSSKLDEFLKKSKLQNYIPNKKLDLTKLPLVEYLLSADNDQEKLDLLFYAKDSTLNSTSRIESRHFYFSWLCLMINQSNSKQNDIYFQNIKNIYLRDKSAEHKEYITRLAKTHTDFNNTDIEKNNINTTINTQNNHMNDEDIKLDDKIDKDNQNEHKVIQNSLSEIKKDINYEDEITRLAKKKIISVLNKKGSKLIEDICKELNINKMVDSNNNKTKKTNFEKDIDFSSWLHLKIFADSLNGGKELMDEIDKILPINSLAPPVFTPVQVCKLLYQSQKWNLSKENQRIFLNVILKILKTVLCVVDTVNVDSNEIENKDTNIDDNLGSTTNMSEIDEENKNSNNDIKNKKIVKKIKRGINNFQPKMYIRPLSAADIKAERKKEDKQNTKSNVAIQPQQPKRSTLLWELENFQNKYLTEMKISEIDLNLIEEGKEVFIKKHEQNQLKLRIEYINRLKSIATQLPTTELPTHDQFEEIYNDIIKSPKECKQSTFAFYVGNMEWLEQVHYKKEGNKLPTDFDKKNKPEAMHKWNHFKILLFHDNINYKKIPKDQNYWNNFNEYIKLYDELYSTKSSNNKRKDIATYKARNKKQRSE